MATKQALALPLPASLLFLLLSCSYLVQGVRFQLSGGTKCVSEEIQVNVLVVAKYHVVSEGQPEGASLPKINARVTSPFGTTLHMQENVVEGSFGFKTTENGGYLACFWVPHAQQNVVVDIDLDWKTGFAAKDWESIAKKDKIEGVELELQRLLDVVETIRDDLLYLRERESVMRDVSEKTNARVAWLSIMSLLICLVVAIWQLWYLKSYFERKKLL